MPQIPLHLYSSSNLRCYLVRAVAAALALWAAVMLFVAVYLQVKPWAPRIDRVWTALFLGVCSVLFGLVAVGLWRRASWAYYVAIAIAVWSMLTFPLGTAIGGFLALCLVVAGRHAAPRSRSRTQVFWRCVVSGLPIFAIVGALIALPSRWRSSPVVSVLGPKARSVRGAMFNLSGGGAWGASGGFVPIARDSRMYLVVYYDAAPRQGQPRMQVQMDGRSLAHTLPEPGTFVVASDLTANQAQHVLKNGVPDSLVEALVEAATTRGWAVRTPGAPLGAHVTVSANEHFP